jgi:hypothetical protein
MRDVWDAIQQRMISEANQHVDKSRRLRVRLLILHPRSSEGLFRQAFEKETIRASAGISIDVPQGLEQIRRAQASLGDDGSADLLEVRLYHHCPFAFLFLTHKDAFVEQYYYRDHTRHVDVALIRYGKEDIQKEFRLSFDAIWASARPSLLLDSDVGTAAAIEAAAINNIFTEEKRIQCGSRQAEALASLGANQEVKILSISGKFYISNPMIPYLIQATENQASIKFLLLNPVCCQAVLRAIADTYPPDQISKQIASWTWQKHRGTRLYREIHTTISELMGRGFAVRLHHSSVSCALFLTPTQAFVEQYLYGRSKMFKSDRVLGGDYPIFEFGQCDGSKRRHNGKHAANEAAGAHTKINKPGEQDTNGEKVLKDTAELQMLSETFEVVWKSYSIGADQYLHLKEEDEFQATLADLQRWTHINGAIDGAAKSVGIGV